jgi:hypothetical protein
MAGLKAPFVIVTNATPSGGGSVVVVVVGRRSDATTASEGPEAMAVPIAANAMNSATTNTLLWINVFLDNVSSRPSVVASVAPSSNHRGPGSHELTADQLVPSKVRVITDP